MIRKTIIVLLSFAVVTTTAVSILSYLDWPGSWTLDHRASGLTVNHHVTRAWRIGWTGHYPYWFEVSKGWLYGPIGGPLWVLVALLATYPAIAVIRGPVRRFRRRRAGLCVECGYNLTGNVSSVCPECGTEIERMP